MRINILYLALFLIFVITIFNLFYKPSILKLFKNKQVIANSEAIPPVFDVFDRLFCPLNGFKCDNYDCDCSQYCSGNYEKINIFSEDDIVLFNEKLEPGTYCIPNGFLKCNLETTIPVYSANNWICVPRSKNIWNGNHLIAYKSSFAQNNDLNVLIDNMTNTIVTSPIKDFYEMYNGKLRYECHCGSKDENNNQMISLEEIPFKCVSDYCLSNIKNSLNIGWDPIKKRCECKQYSHEIPTNPATPCVKYFTGLSSDNITFYGAIKCTDKNSRILYPFFCTDDMQDNYLYFNKFVTSERTPKDYLTKVI